MLCKWDKIAFVMHFSTAMHSVTEHCHVIEQGVHVRTCLRHSCLCEIGADLLETLRCAAPRSLPRGIKSDRAS